MKLGHVIDIELGQSFQGIFCMIWRIRPILIWVIHLVRAQNFPKNQHFLLHDTSFSFFNLLVFRF